MDEVEGAPSLQTASDDVDHVCGPCKYEEEEKEATRFCNDCKEFLCSGCSTSHRGLKVTRNHKLIAIAEWSVTSAAITEPKRVFCECNRNNVVSVYCEDHANVICRPCSSLKHRKCNVISISKKAESYSGENFKFISQKGNKIVAEIDEYVNCRRSDMQSLENMKEKCFKVIKAFRQEINEKLDTLEKESIEALKKQELVAQKDIEQHLPACVSTKEMLETDIKLIDDIKNSSSKADMFAADILLSNRFNEFEKFLQDIKEEKQFPNIYFEEDKQLSGIFINESKLGRVLYKYKPKLFTDLEIVNSSSVGIRIKDSTCPSITGCALMPDGKVVLCDFSNESVKVLGDNLQTYDTLAVPSSPQDVSVINDTCVMITLPNLKQLRYIQVVPTMKMGFRVQLDQMCYGIDVVGDEMYVACHDAPGNGKIKILDINGILKRTIPLTMYDIPTYITVNAKSGKIYISDRETSSISCLMPSGKVIYEYKDKSLVHPRKSCLDEEANILVCGESSDTVQIITAAGNKHSTLLTATDGIRKPRCAVYKQMDKTLIVTCENNDKLYIFRTK